MVDGVDEKEISKKGSLPVGASVAAMKGTSVRGAGMPTEFSTVGACVKDSSLGEKVISLSDASCVGAIVMDAEANWLGDNVISSVEFSCVMAKVGASVGEITGCLLGRSLGL